MKPTAYVMMGMPASGKSTLVSQLMKICDDFTFYYSTDAYIDGIAAAQGKTYNDVFSDHIKDATREMNNALKAAINNERDIVWDQTNLTVGKRKHIVDNLTKAGYELVLYNTHPTTMEELQTVLYRLEDRPGKTIPNHVILSMIKSYQEPTHAEGWSDIRNWGIYSDMVIV